MGDLDLDSLDPRKATPGQVADLIAEVRRLTDLLHAKEAWIDGAKVDLDGYDEARAAIARVEALCADGVVGLSHGCTCSGDEHVEGSCRYGEAMAWSLNPDAVRAALRGDS